MLSPRGGTWSGVSGTKGKETIERTLEGRRVHGRTSVVLGSCCVSSERYWDFFVKGQAFKKLGLTFFLLLMKFYDCIVTFLSIFVALLRFTSYRFHISYLS